MGTQLPLPKKRAEPPSPTFGPCLLWPKGWMDQDGTCHEGGPWSRPHCSRWDPAPLLKKGAEPPPQFRPIFGRLFALCCQTVVCPICLSCVSVTLVYFRQTLGPIKMPLGMKVGFDPGDFVLDRDPAQSPKRGRSPLPKFSAHVYCGQTTGWIKMILGMEVGLSPGDFVLDGDPAPSPKRERSPHAQFSADFYCGQTAGCIKMPLGMEVGLGLGHIVLDGDPSPLLKKGA